MSKYPSLDRVWEDIKRCYRCGYCRDMVRDLTGTFRSCPVREKLRHEHYCARGRNTIARGLLEGRLDFSYGLRDAVFTCLMCGGCHDACSLIDWAKVDTPAITQAMREEIHRLGMTPKKILHVQRVKAAQGKSDNTATCQIACPIDQDVPAYVGLVAQCKFSEALEVIREANPLPSVCGRACTHPCEFYCRQSEIGEPISIMRLKRFCVDQELKHGQKPLPLKTQIQNSHAVAVVGSGPAGLSAANYLARRGFSVTIFEKNQLPGGMMVYSIPDFTLPREAVLYDIERVKEQGVQIKTGIQIGKDKSTVRLLDEGFRAVLLCLGAWSSSTMGIPGEDLNGVWKGLDFLIRIKRGEKISVPQKVIVIGGGKVAIDAARTAVRLGAREVTVCYRRAKEEMPVEEESIARALEEGVCIRETLLPVEVLGENGQVRSVKVREVHCIEVDQDGKAVPFCIEGSDIEIEAQMVIFAIGQKPDLSAIDSEGSIPVTGEGTVSVDDRFRMGALPIFAAGDAISGPSSIVEAMASGREAAKAIEAYLKGSNAVKEMPKLDSAALPARQLKLHLDRIVAPRTRMPMIGVRRKRASFEEVEKGFSEGKARQESLRCLACDLKRFSDLPLSEGADSLFFIGCNDYYRYPEVAQAALNILTRAGVKVTISEKELCCGSPAFWSGNASLTEELKAKNIALFHDLGIKRIITACSDCYEMLSKHYDLGIHHISIEHFAQTFSGILDQKKVRLNGYEGSVTYHDPCQLARRGGVMEEPRAILNQIEGLRLVEMKRHKKGTWCCGGGPNRLVHLSSPELANEIGRERLAEAMETKAQALITSCPWCRTQFDALQTDGLKVYDLPYFVYNIVGIKEN